MVFRSSLSLSFMRHGHGVIAVHLMRFWEGGVFFERMFSILAMVTDIFSFE